MLVTCHKTIPLFKKPKPLKLVDSMSKMLLGGTNPSWLIEIICAITPSSKSNVEKDDLLILHASCTTYKYQD